MSFSIEFTATQPDAMHIIAETPYLPTSVKGFLDQAVSALKPNALVYVKAMGHLHNGTANDYQRSNADIVVQEVVLRVSK
jgi:hypothetical protein